MEIDGAKLRAARERRLLTVRELAAKAQVSPDTVSRLENNQRPAHISTVRKLADALQVEAAALLRP